MTNLGKVTYATNILVSMYTIRSLYNAVSDIKETALTVNYSVMKLITLESGDQSQSETLYDQIDLPSTVEVLNHLLHHNSVQTKVAVLRWILHLYNKIPTKVLTKFLLIFK